MDMSLEHATQKAVEKQVAQLFEKAAHYDTMFIFLREWFHHKGLHFTASEYGIWALQERHTGVNVSQHVHLNDALKAAFDWVEEHQPNT